MRFFKSFRLLHRRTKSEGDVIAVLAAQSATQTACGSLRPSHQDLLDVAFESSPLIADTGHFTPPKNALPFFDPVDLYAPFLYATPPCILGPSADPTVIRLEAELAALREANRTLEADQVEITKEAADVRTALYAEMTKNAQLKRQVMIDAERIQTFTVSFTRYKAIDCLLARIGIHKAVLEEALAALEDGGNPEDVVMSAIKQARIKADHTGPGTAITGHRTPEQYGAVLKMTLKVRKELKGHKKITKFWKRAAQQDGKHKDTITPSPSDISSIHETLSPERQKAVDDLAVRRREILTCGLTASDSISIAKDANLRASRVATVQSNNPDLSTASMSISDTPYAIYTDVETALPPLASESIKRELAQHSTSRRSSRNRPVERPQLSVLRPVDLNILETFTILEPASQPRMSQRRQTVPASSLTHRRYPSSTSEISSGRISKRGHRSDTVCSSRSFVSLLSTSLRKSDVSRFAKASAKTSDQGSLSSTRHSSDIGNNVPVDNTVFQDVASDGDPIPAILQSGSGSRFLEHIIIESTPTESFQHGASLGHISEESVIIHDQDITFTAHTTPTTAPTTPSQTPNLSKTPDSSPTKKSKLPVLKYLRRLSPLSSPTKTVMNVNVTTPSKVPKHRGRSSSSPAPAQRSAIPVKTRRPTVTGGQNSTR